MSVRRSALKVVWIEVFLGQRVDMLSDSRESRHQAFLSCLNKRCCHGNTDRVTVDWFEFLVYFHDV